MQPGHEPVALRLGERVRALHLDGVLGRDDEERPGQQVADAVDRDLGLLHALQERRLGLGRGAVDLVADHDVGEDRAGPELEPLVGLPVDADAGQVAGQQVGRELDPADRAVDGVRQRLGQGGLADAGHVLDQQVALGEQDGDGVPHQVRPAGDHSLHRRRGCVPRVPARSAISSAVGSAWTIVSFLSAGRSLRDADGASLACAAARPDGRRAGRPWTRPHGACTHPVPPPSHRATSGRDDAVRRAAAARERGWARPPLRRAHGRLVAPITLHFAPPHLTCTIGVESPESRAIRGP